MTPLQRYTQYVALCWSESYLPTRGPGLEEFKVILKDMVIDRCFDFSVDESVVSKQFDK